MDFIELPRTVTPCAAFQNKPIGQHELELILRAGQLAPTACNRQPQRILVINSADGLGATAPMHRVPL